MGAKVQLFFVHLHKKTMSTIALEKKKKKAIESIYPNKKQVAKKKEYIEAEIDEFIEQLSQQVNRNMSYKFMFNHYKQMLKKE